MKTFLFLAIILLIGFLLRSGMFLHGDFLYLSDQARDLLLAKDIVVDHDLTLIGGRTGFGGLYHGAIWIYMIAPLFFLTDGNPFWSLVPLFVIVNLGIILAGFLVGWRLYGKGVGLLLAFFLAISRELINVTPVTTNAEMLPLVLIFYLYSTIKFVRGSDMHIALSLFLVGLGFQFEAAFAILLFPILFIAVLVRKKLPSIKSLILGAIGFLIAVSTFILFDLRHNFLMTSSAIKLFTNTQRPLSGYEEYADIGFRVIDRLQNLWSGFFTPLYTKDTFTSIMLLLILSIGLLIVLKRIYFKEIKLLEKEIIFFLLAPFIVFGIYILYPLPLWSHYLLPVAVLASFILSLSIFVLWQKPILKPIVISLIIAASLPTITSIKNGYLPGSPYISGGDGSYLNQLQVSKWMLSDARNKESGYFVYTPGVLTYNMDYLVWWLSATNGLQNLQSRKTESTYLILYKPLDGDDSAHSFWKENILNISDEPQFSRTFNGGIIVEKLDLSKDAKPVDQNYFQNLIFR